jgi:hypothetical protein
MRSFASIRGGEFRALAQIVLQAAADSGGRVDERLFDAISIGAC